VLRHVSAHGVAGDEKSSLPVPEGVVQGVRPFVVGHPKLDATRRQVRRLLGVPDDPGDLLPSGEKLLDDQTAQVPGGSGDDDAHDAAPSMTAPTSAFVADQEATVRSCR